MMEMLWNVKLKSPHPVRIAVALHHLLPLLVNNFKY